MTASAQTVPVLVRADEAENLQDGALSLITLLADAGQTGGALTANKATLRKGSPGAPAHFHTAATEMFLVLDGSVRILLGENIVRLEQGDFLTVPPTVPHAFAPAAGADAELLVVFSPGCTGSTTTGCSNGFIAARRASRRSGRARNATTTTTSTAPSGEMSSPTPEHPRSRRVPADSVHALNGRGW